MNNRTISIDTINIIIPSPEDVDNEDLDKAIVLLREARERISIHVKLEGEECKNCDIWLDDIDNFVESVSND